jgi:hypothetical protein
MRRLLALLCLAVCVRAEADSSVQITGPRTTKAAITWPVKLTDGTELLLARITRGVVDCLQGEVRKFFIVDAPRMPTTETSFSLPAGKWRCTIIVFTEDDLRTEAPHLPLAPLPGELRIVE